MAPDEPVELRPASPYASEGRPAYAPRVPWKWLALGAVGLAVVVGGYFARRAGQEDALRGAVARALDERLAPIAADYRAFRAKLEAWVLAAARETPRGTADPRLRLSSLHGGRGLYLRLAASDATSAAGIARGASAMGRDGITRCLGIAPVSARGLYEQGAFLMPAWGEDAKRAEGLMKLRVIDHELATRTERDLPNLMAMLRSEYFLLVLERGPSRAEGPVDVFLWSLRDGGDAKPLLSVRAEAAGTLVPVRIGGAPRAPAPSAERGELAAADCSIAAAIKAAGGEPTLDFGSEVTPPPAPAAGEALVPPADASAPTAAPPTSTAAPSP